MRNVPSKSNQRRRQLKAQNRKISLRNRVYYRVVLATSEELEQATEYNWRDEPVKS